MTGESYPGRAAECLAGPRPTLIPPLGKPSHQNRFSGQRTPELEEWPRRPRIGRMFEDIPASLALAMTRAIRSQCLTPKLAPYWSTSRAGTGGRALGRPCRSRNFPQPQFNTQMPRPAQYLARPVAEPAARVMCGYPTESAATSKPAMLVQPCGGRVRKRANAAIVELPGGAGTLHVPIRPNQASQPGYAYVLKPCHLKRIDSKGSERHPRRGHETPFECERGLSRGARFAVAWHLPNTTSQS